MMSRYEVTLENYKGGKVYEMCATEGLSVANTYFHHKEVRVH